MVHFDCLIKFTIVFEISGLTDFGRDTLIDDFVLGCDSHSLSSKLLINIKGMACKI